MSLPTFIEQYLERHQIHARESEHPAVYTAHQLAEVEHVPDSQIAKVVFLFMDDTMVMSVLPANRNLNLHLIRVATQVGYIRLATEREITDRVNGVDLGAIPPFGSLFGMPVLMDKACLDLKQIEIPGGRLTRALIIDLDDYLREESPRVMELSRKPIRRTMHQPRPEKYEYY